MLSFPGLTGESRNAIWMPDRVRHDGYCKAISETLHCSLLSALCFPRSKLRGNLEVGGKKLPTQRGHETTMTPKPAQKETSNWTKRHSFMMGELASLCSVAQWRAAVAFASDKGQEDGCRNGKDFPKGRKALAPLGFPYNLKRVFGFKL
jgi:hypothetical protein